MTLAQELKGAHQDIQKSIPEQSDVFDADTMAMMELEIDKKSLRKGDMIPDFTLPDQLGRKVNIRDLLKKGPVVISFNRGSWCPYCNLELNALKKHLPRFEELGASLIAISPQKPDESLSTAQKHNLEFPVLSDDNNETAKKFGLVFTLSTQVQEIYKTFGINLDQINSTGNFDLPVPGTFIVNPKGVIIDLFVNADYKQRMEPVRIIEALEENNA